MPADDYATFPQPFSYRKDVLNFFFFSSRRRHTRFDCDWSSDVCSSDLGDLLLIGSQVIRFRRLGYPGPHPPDADATKRMGSLIPSADIASLTQLRSDEIGRASCRERV